MPYGVVSIQLVRFHVFRLVFCQVRDMPREKDVRELNAVSEKNGWLIYFGLFAQGFSRLLCPTKLFFFLSTKTLFIAYGLLIFIFLMR